MSSRKPESQGFTDSSRPIAILARGLTKSFAIYQRPGLRLKEILWPGNRSFHQEFVALRDLDLEVYKGETVGIVGRNGSGKSTLLNLVCGTLEPTSGQMKVSGHLAPILTLGAGFDPEFTGRENVLMNAAIIGIPRVEIEQRLDSIIAFAGIGEFFDRPVKLYSSGMYARLAFAIAINADPEILVIDEILSVGDEAFARKCFARLEDLKSQGSTILFVSHSSQMVIELCDRAVLIEGGERLLSGTPRDVVAYYHKLLYAPEEQRPSLVEEIRVFDETGSAPGKNEATETAGQDESRKLGRFDPNLKPESTSEYERLGAQIQNIRLLNQKGDVVNVLERGGEYTYEYEVLFTEAAYSVQFGMMIKTGTGLEIAGQVSHTAHDLIENIPKNHRARVGLPFKANLAPGTYFANAGVMGQREGEITYLHRILDAVAFRVDPVGQDRATGRTDLTLPGQWSEIHPED
jgi:lipopolysaccharide transport system ATP-binding protein